MNTYSFYHRDTGLFNGTVILLSDEKTLALNTPADHIAIEGAHDGFSKRVEVSTGSVIEYQPPSPGANFEWNAILKRWQLNGATQAQLAAHASAAVQIRALEATQHRAVREVLLGKAGALALLQSIDSQITALEAESLKDISP